jgi:integrase/recombinase XerC
MLAPFLHYLKREGLDLDAVGYREAQGYQSALAGSSLPDGSLRYRSHTVSEMVGAVGRFYAWLKGEGTVGRQPFADLDPVRCPDPLPRNLPDERTMEALLSRFRAWREAKYRRDRKSLYRVHVIGELLYASGLRIDELARLEVEDLELPSKTLRVRHGKGGRERVAYLNEYSACVLELWVKRMRGLYCGRHAAPTLFGVKSGKMLDEAVNAHLKREASGFGLERFTAHAIRHTLGFHLLRRGCDLRYIQLILGHASLSATTLYTRVEKTDLRGQLDRFHPRGGRDEPQSRAGGAVPGGS